MQKILCAVVIIVVAFSTVSAFASQPTLSLEQVMSRRQSVRSYTDEDISGQQLLDVLWAAYGHMRVPRSVLIIFPVTRIGSYRYNPENNSLIVHDLNVNKETIRPHDQGWPSDASVVLVVVWNQTAMTNPHFALAEAGQLVQNVYLASASVNLGTCCVGGIDSEGLREDLGLPSTFTPLLVMPVGFPTTPYPPASPNYDFMVGNLPPVQYSDLSFEDSLRNMRFVKEWAAENLSLQELSQLLWAAYGYTNVTHGDTYHRTTPSAMGIYPLIIFVSNASGVFRYVPEKHSAVEVVHGDKRVDIIDAFGDQVWAANAPAIFLIVCNSSFVENDGTIPFSSVEIGAGAVVQQLFLEASAWNLGVNVIGESFEDWNGTGAEELSKVLGLSSSLIPLYAVPIGAISQKATFNIWTDKTIYYKGETMNVYVRLKNPSVATQVSIGIALLQPDGKILPLLSQTIWLPPNFDSGDVLYEAFKIPNAQLGSYKWIAYLRDVGTETIIFLSIWEWQLVAR